MTDSKLKSKSMDRLFEAILLLKDADECYNFFEDLCSIPELKIMAQRFDVAELLYENVTYQSISTITKASTATISRVRRSLEYGVGGYKMILKQLKGEQSVK